jgi:hypothetical protein
VTPGGDGMYELSMPIAAELILGVARRLLVFAKSRLGAKKSMLRVAGTMLRSAEWTLTLARAVLISAQINADLR